MATSGDELDPVDHLADEFMDRQRRGERPTIDEYVDRYPELADEIREVFPALAMIEQMAPAAADLKESQRIVGAPTETSQRQVGDYHILREVGRGGMGVVYEAEQESLGRRVALKVLLNEMSASTRSMQRFQREARAAARMHHTNIVPVFEVGQEGDTAFYAMQLIQGQGLDLVIEDLKRLRRDSSRSGGKRPVPPSREAAPSIADSLVSGKFLQADLVAEMNLHPANSNHEPDQTFGETAEHRIDSTPSAALPGDSEISTAETNRGRFHLGVARIGMQTADALAYAHARGIIHRDIKPSNLILDAGGVVWITDFGLAKTDDDAMTHTGDILGTMRYMSPERFRGQCDVRADVYALGLTLYELLLLKPAFDSPDRLKLIEMVRQSEPPTPRSIDPRIPRDLETIVLKSIDKDPKRRYQSADDLSEDLRRFVDDEPVKARRISLPERLVRWSRRNKAVAASLTTVALLLIATALVSSIAAARAQRARADAERAGQRTLYALAEAKKQRQRAEYEKYVSQIGLAAANLDRGERVVARQGLLDTQSEYRNWEWGYLISLAWPPQIEVDPGEVRASRPDLSAVDLWKMGPAHVIKRLDAGRRDIASHASAFTTDKHIGKLVTWGSAGRLWDVRTGKELFSFPKHNSIVFATAFSNDDKRLAAGGGGGDLVLLDTDSKATLWTEELSTHAIGGIWFSPDDTRLVAADEGGNVNVLETDSGHIICTFSEHTSQVQSLRFRADGKSVASASRDGSIKFWELETGREILSPVSVPARGGRGTRVVQISPKGPQVVVGYFDGSIMLWDWGNGQGHDLFKGNDPINEIFFSHDGSCLFVAEGEQTIRILDTAGQQVTSLMTPLYHINPIAVSAGSALIATNSPDGTTSIWGPVYRKTQRRQMLGSAHDDLVLQAAFSRTGDRIVTASYDKVARVWDSASQQLIIEFREHEHELLKAEFSPDGRYVASVDCRGTVCVWDAENGDEAFRVTTDAEAFFDAVSFKGRLHGEILSFSAGLSSSPFFEGGLVVNDGREMAVFDYPNGRRLLKLEENPQIGWPVIGPHSKRVATITSTLNEIHLWNLNTGHKLHILAGHQQQAYGAAFSPDGSRLVTNSMDGHAIVWDVLTGDQLLTVDHGGDNVKTVRFCPKGERIATTTGSIARIWDAITGRELSTFDNHTHRMTNVEFSPDGERVLTTALDNTVRVWDPAERDARELVQFTRDSKLIYGTWSPDGGKILTCWSDGSVHLLEAFPWKDSGDDSLAMDERVQKWRARPSLQ